MSGVDAIFNSVPVEESPSGGESTAKDAGDRIRKGSVGDRISAFGELVEEDDYGQDDKKGFEGASVEKDKTPVSGEKDKKETEREKVVNKKDDEQKEVEESEEKLVQEKKEEVKEEPQKYKVKIDGKEVEVSLEDLKADYSGKQAISKRFTEFDKTKKEFEKEKVQYDADIKNIQKEVGEIREGFDSIINEYKKNGFLTKNPLHVVESLLDRMGINSYDFNRAMFEHNLPEYAKFFEMDENQQDAYFAKKENEFLRKKDQTLAERTAKAQSETERQKQEFNLIKGAGLSVDAYNELFSELEELGDKELSVERVIEFAKLKPIMNKAGDIVSKTSKAGDIELINSVSSLLMQFPNTTEEEIISHIDGSAQAEKVSKALKDKENFSVKSKKTKQGFTDGDEDFDMELFKSIRRR